MVSQMLVSYQDGASVNLDADKNQIISTRTNIKYKSAFIWLAQCQITAVDSLQKLQYIYRPL